MALISKIYDVKYYPNCCISYVIELINFEQKSFSEKIYMIYTLKVSVQLIHNTLVITKVIKVTNSDLLEFIFLRYELRLPPKSEKVWIYKSFSPTKI